MKLPSVFEMLCSALWAFMLALIIACLCTSCTPKCLPELVEVHDTIRTHDSVYVDRWRDSVVQKVDSTYEYVKDSTVEKQKGDTVWMFKYRDRFVFKCSDTSERVESASDSTRTQYKYIIKTKTQVIKPPPERYVPKYYRIISWLFWIVFIIVAIGIALRVMGRRIW